MNVLSLSYGKDSMACLGACEKLGIKIDRIVHAEIWATDTIPADLPPMVDFKAKADEIIKRRYGIEVEHYSAKYVGGIRSDKVTYEKHFYKIKSSGKHSGSIYGFPMVKGNWCTKLKLNAIKECEKSKKRDSVDLVGIAADETKRLARLDGVKKISPLQIAGWDESHCKEWCKKNDLLSPIYRTSNRGGCWFCHNQGVQQLRILREQYPQYWEMMLKWDLDSPVSFHPDGHTVHDFDKRFQLEDEGLIDPLAYFRWNMLDAELNFRFQL